MKRVGVACDTSLCYNGSHASGHCCFAARHFTRNFRAGATDRLRVGCSPTREREIFKLIGVMSHGAFKKRAGETHRRRNGSYRDFETGPLKFLPFAPRVGERDIASCNARVAPDRVTRQTRYDTYR